MAPRAYVRRLLPAISEMRKARIYSWADMSSYLRLQGFKLPNGTAFTEKRLRDLSARTYLFDWY